MYALFACWQVLGVWERIESALIGAADAQGKLSWQASVDSTTARAHVHASGTRRDSVVRGRDDRTASDRSTAVVHGSPGRPPFWAREVGLWPKSQGTPWNSW
jgi:hypothetical protein